MLGEGTYLLMLLSTSWRAVRELAYLLLLWSSRWRVVRELSYLLLLEGGEGVVLSFDVVVV